MYTKDNTRKVEDIVKEQIARVNEALVISANNNLKVDEAFYNQIPFPSSELKAILTYKDLTIKQYREIIELQFTGMIDLLAANSQLEKSFETMKYLYEVERQKNDGTFTRN